MPVGTVNVVRPGKTFKEIYLVPSGFQQGLEEVLIVIEGVHQQIPEARAESAPGVYIMPSPAVSSMPAPGAKGNAGGSAPVTSPPAGMSSALMTDADRLRERYKQLGEAQKHVFGTGLPGSKPPDFNIDVNKPKAPQPGASAQTSPGSGTGAGPSAASPKPAAPAADSPRPAPTQPATGQQPAARSSAPATSPKPTQTPGGSNTGGSGVITTPPAKPAIRTAPSTDAPAPPAKPKPDPERETPAR
jgi:hypothetical protein